MLVKSLDLDGLGDGRSICLSSIFHRSSSMFLVRIGIVICSQYVVLTYDSNY